MGINMTLIAQLKEIVDNSLNERSPIKIGHACLTLETMLNSTQDSADKARISEALDSVESHYKSRNDECLNAPWHEYMTLAWYDENINLLWKHIHTDNVRVMAPTETTKRLLTTHVVHFVEKLQNLRNEKTPGHPACIARHEQDIRNIIMYAQEHAARSSSPLFFMLPPDPNDLNLNQPTQILQVPGAGGIADMPFDPDNSNRPS